MSFSEGAERQLRVWEQTHVLQAVVDHIIAETYEGLTVPYSDSTAMADAAS